MNNNYKYNPEDFRGMLNLSDELYAFYKLYEIYNKNKTQHNRFAFEKHWEDLFFTIKHREVEGFLNSVLADEIRNYLGELASG